jgi:Flp pilus assembly protein TadD
VHPRCVRETELDFEEGIELWKAGDPESARDALRYALSACHDNIRAHVALGQIALSEFRDPSLARGHFGYAFELVHRSLPPGFAGRLAPQRAANRPFYDAAAGLAECLKALGKVEDGEWLRRLVERLSGGSR